MAAELATLGVKIETDASGARTFVQSQEQMARSAETSAARRKKAEDSVYQSIADRGGKTLAEVRARFQQANQAAVAHQKAVAPIAQSYARAGNAVATFTGSLRQGTTAATAQARAVNGTATANNNAVKSQRAHASAIGSTGASLASMARKFIAYVGVVTAGYLSIRGAIKLFSGAMKTASDFEDMRFKLEATIGSASKAKRVFEGLRELPNIFPLEDWNNAASTLSTVGVKSDQLLGKLQTFGDLAAREGNLDAIVKLYTDVVQKGAISMQQLNAFKEQGVQLLPALSAAMGKPQTEVMALISKGKVGIDELDKALTRLANTDFLGAAAAKAATMTGHVQDLGSAWDDVQEAFGREVSTPLKTTVDLLTQALRAAVPDAVSFGQAVAGWINILNAWFQSNNKWDLFVAGFDVAAAHMNLALTKAVSSAIQQLRDASWNFQTGLVKKGVGTIGEAGQAGLYASSKSGSASPLVQSTAFMTGWTKSLFTSASEGVKQGFGGVEQASALLSEKEAAWAAAVANSTPMTTAFAANLAAATGVVSRFSATLASFRLPNIQAATALGGATNTNTFGGANQQGFDPNVDFSLGAGATGGQMNLGGYGLTPDYEAPTYTPPAGWNTHAENAAPTPGVRPTTGGGGGGGGGGGSGSSGGGTSTGDFKTDIEVLEKYQRQLEEINATAMGTKEKMRAISEAEAGAINQMADPMSYVDLLATDKDIADKRLTIWRAAERERVLASQEVNERIKANQGSVNDVLTQGIDRLNQQWGSMQEQMVGAIVDIGNSISNNISSNLIAISDGSKSAGQAFKDMAVGMLRDISNIIIKMLVQLAIQYALRSAGFGGGGEVPTSSFALGGAIKGPSHASGGVPIEAEGGEFIIRKDRVRNEDIDKLYAYNAGKAEIVPKFATGGNVSSSRGAWTGGYDPNEAGGWINQMGLDSSQWSPGVPDPQDPAFGGLHLPGTDTPLQQPIADTPPVFVSESPGGPTVTVGGEGGGAGTAWEGGVPSGATSYGTSPAGGAYGPGSGPTAMSTFWGPSNGTQAVDTSWFNFLDDFISGSTRPSTTVKEEANGGLIRRFHSGGILGEFARGGEVPFVGKKGEGVFTQQQMANLAPVTNRSDSIQNNITINVEDSGKSKSQGGMDDKDSRELARAVEAITIATIQKQKRHRGVLDMKSR